MKLKHQSDPSNSDLAEAMAHPGKNVPYRQLRKSVQRQPVNRGAAHCRRRGRELSGLDIIVIIIVAVVVVNVVNVVAFR